jgi:hypothetical protein
MLMSGLRTAVLRAKAVNCAVVAGLHLLHRQTLNHAADIDRSPAVGSGLRFNGQSSPRRNTSSLGSDPRLEDFRLDSLGHPGWGGTQLGHRGVGKGGS